MEGWLVLPPYTCHSSTLSTTSAELYNMLVHVAPPPSPSQSRIQPRSREVSCHPPSLVVLHDLLLKVAWYCCSSYAAATTSLTLHKIQEIFYNGSVQHLYCHSSGLLLVSWQNAKLQALLELPSPRVFLLLNVEITGDIVRGCGLNKLCNTPLLARHCCHLSIQTLICWWLSFHRIDKASARTFSFPGRYRISTFCMLF